MMAESLRREKSSSRGLLNNYRYLCKKAMVSCAMENARTRKKRQQKMIIANMKMKRTDPHQELLDTDKLIKKIKPVAMKQETLSTLNSKTSSSDSSEHTGSDHHSLMTTLGDSWEVDSGFFSEASPPASGRSSPYPIPTTVVALDCEMVGTGPGGRCSELGRCSILDYHGNVLYDKYIRPCQPVTNFRTQWSGIRRHHLHNATPFAQAREEIQSILEGKVVVGHAVYNDFEALDMIHPCHMVRDTSSTHLLIRLAGFHRKPCISLKILASKLLNRRIQVGKQGHCSVEDAQAALDLYKLVECEWEQELQTMLRDDDAPVELNFALSDHYLQDEYWPDDITADSQWEESNIDSVKNTSTSQ
ncbi:apoptosis-enhancing nuclease [Pholidichthys leucotaenia]